MASKKIKDLSVKVGEYQANVQTKGKYENVGSMFKSDDGSVYLRLKRTFNPAGVAGDDTIIIGVYDLKQDGQQQPQQAAPQQSSVNDDDIPF